MLVENNLENHDFIGNAHIGFSVETPIRDGAFDMSNDDKIKQIEHHFARIMYELGLDLQDDSLKGTPYRVAKMFVKELFYGLDPLNKPNISTFENKYSYSSMLVESNITVCSSCEHHFLPILGKAHVGYISNGTVIGLSKINRIVEYYSRRPQVQERLTMQIFNELKDILNTDNIIVAIDAEHLCVSTRGIQDKSSITHTIEYGGVFKDQNHRSEFWATVNNRIK